MLEELKDVKQGYISIYPDWKKANANKLNSGAAAEAAAQTLCRKYEKPANTEAKAKERGETAILIYYIMSAPVSI
jgi:IMP cyclohydrolase